MALVAEFTSFGALATEWTVGASPPFLLLRCLGETSPRPGSQREINAFQIKEMMKIVPAAWRPASRVKVCGLTSPEDALLAAELGADFIGLNFHPPSPRWVAPARAAEIAAAVRGKAKVVGVFVNRPAEEIVAIDAEVGLDLVQLHGDETPAQARAFAPRAIRALRVAGTLEPGWLAEWDEVWGLLIDSHQPGLYGGTGTSWDFATLGSAGASRPVFIAGGLSPQNVRAAIAAARPWGVDVCSGVESVPGRKDPALLERFFKEIHDGTCPSST